MGSRPWANGRDRGASGVFLTPTAFHSTAQGRVAPLGPVAHPTHTPKGFHKDTHHAPLAVDPSLHLGAVPLLRPGGGAAPAGPGAARRRAQRRRLGRARRAGQDGHRAALAAAPCRRVGGVDGVFLWSFYRGKDSDLCLRELFAYAEGLAGAAGGVGQLLRRSAAAAAAAGALGGRARRRRGRAARSGAVVWPLRPSGAGPAARGAGVGADARRRGADDAASRCRRWHSRRHARVLSLGTLDAGQRRRPAATAWACTATPRSWPRRRRPCGLHAKAVELLGTWLVALPRAATRPARATCRAGRRAEGGQRRGAARRPRAGRVSATALPQRDAGHPRPGHGVPPAADRGAAARLPRQRAGAPPAARRPGGRSYAPFAERPRRLAGGAGRRSWSTLRLLERVGCARRAGGRGARRPPAGAARLRGRAGRRATHGAPARAGFLRGRPDRRPPATLEEAREEVELFHAYCDAGLWNEADSTFVALDNPKHRFLAPGLRARPAAALLPRRRLAAAAAVARLRPLAQPGDLLRDARPVRGRAGVYRPADAPCAATP